MIETADNKSCGWPHPSHLHSHQITGLKVTDVQHQLPHQWHQYQRDWEALGVHTVANGPIGKLGAM